MAYIIEYTDTITGIRTLMNWCGDKKQCKRTAREMRRTNRGSRPSIKPFVVQENMLVC